MTTNCLCGSPATRWIDTISVHVCERCWQTHVAHIRRTTDADD
ncbi:hypothetical protein [Halarchaeum salinum]